MTTITLGYNDDILTSAIVADVRLGTDTTFLTAANRISRALDVGGAVYDFGTLGERVWIGDGASGTNAIERPR